MGILLGVILLVLCELCENEQACPKEDIDMDLASITSLEEGLACEPERMVFAASMYNETIRNWIGTDLSYQRYQNLSENISTDDCFV